ncbi:hypothetical protein [Bacillus sp. X1(2014)]|uniref:hypothetical protein n=1 Tax=Bacillus sp. X1(2014) TaxID=1565991 RepID=UPI001642D989|nr:hypothetical protein [Bacillus sp. X1(2014)]
MTFPVLEGKVAIKVDISKSEEVQKQGNGGSIINISASDASSYVTGTTIHVDAGFTSR